MESNVKKNFRISAIFICVIALIMSLMLSVMLYVKPVRAEGGEVFVIKNGAGVKLSQNGLRFVVKMDKAYRDLIVDNDDVKLHGYIAPVEEFDKVSEYNKLSNKVGKVLDESKIYEKEGYYYANLAMTNLDQYTSGGVKLYAKSFSATFYIEDTRSGSPVYTYAEMAKGDNGVEDIELQNRTQYKVVNSALLDGEKDYESQIIATYGAWFGSEDYPIVISNEKEYDAFVAKLQNSEFASKITEKYVFVKQGVSDKKGNSDDDTFANVEVNEKIGHAVTYNDGYKVLAVDFVVHGEDSTPPANPTRSGFKFVGWSGVTTDITEDVTIYATWQPAQGDVKDIGNMKVYGVTRADGAEIKNDSDVIGQKVSLMGGTLGHGAYYPDTYNGETRETDNPTDKDNTANQSYLAFDGNYGFGDYFVADFTGKNMPTLAFFANNYDKSMFYGDGNKDGVVVATGLTLPDGTLFTEENSYSTSVFNGAGLCMWGPHMIYNTGHHDNANNNVLLHSNEENVALGRANLVNGKKYRIIMGMEPGDDTQNNKAIKLVYLLYDLDNDCIVESKAINSYNFFTDGWTNAGQTRDDYCKGSIVAYGHFDTAVTLDKVYGIYEDSHVGSICESFGMTAAYNVEFNGDSIVLGKGSLGFGANHEGPNANDYVHQSYLALNGNYGLGDYIAFDFTGKNMPEIAFFAKNYNDSMFYQYGDKQGIVFVNGMTMYNGDTKTDILNDGKRVNITWPYMINGANGIQQTDFTANSVNDSKLARVNLVDETQYRVIVGFKKGSSHSATTGITLMWKLYNRDTNELIEENSINVYGFFSGSNAKVNNMSLNDLVGSIVLYGKFGTTCTIDKLHGVFEDTDIETVARYVENDRKTVTFENWDGTELYSESFLVGDMPEYLGATPTRPADFTCSSYTFTGWDKELSAVTAEVTYTAIFEGTFRTNVKTSGGVDHTYDVEQTANKIVLKKSNLGDGAAYTTGQNNNDGAWVHQSYLAFDGDYGLGDYVAFDFTGKNMPEIMFFAKNYDDSMYYSEGKQGMVVASGITLYNGTIGSAQSNNTKIGMSGPFGAYFEGAAEPHGGNMFGDTDSKLARANLIDGTHYRVVIGIAKNSNLITLKYWLYDLDNKALVEEKSIDAWNFFTGENPAVGNMTLNDLVGSIVLYGKFGATLTLDKVHGVFENTDISTVAAGLSGVKRTVTFQDDQGTVYQQEELVYGSYPVYKGAEPQKAPDSVYEYTFAGWDKQISIVSGDTVYTAKFNAEIKENVSVKNVTVNGDSIILVDGNIGDGANYTIGQNANANGFVTQSYYAIDGEYGLGDFIVFDFTGKNMPEVMFFAKNYNTSMYYSEGKQGMVVASGITDWGGDSMADNIGSAQANNTKVGVSGPFGAYYQGAAAPHGGNMLSDFESKLARANLVDGTKYRIIMGISRGGSGTTFVLNFYLYNLTDGEEVEKTYQQSWGHYTGEDPKVDNMTLDDLVGSIVLYGKFYGECTIDKLYGVYEDTNLEDLISEVIPSDQGGEFVPPTSNAPDYSGYTDQFDFYAYSSYSNGYYEIDGEKYYVGKNLANLKQYSLYGEAGMTIYFPQNSVYVNGSEQSIANVKALIDDLAKVGIYKTIVQDSRILHLSLQESAIVGSGLAYANNDALDAYIYECVKEYASYPGVYGIQLGDEPKYACLSAYSAVYNSIKRVNQKYGFNLFIQYNLNPLNFTETVYTNYYPESRGTHDWSDFRYTLGIKDRYDACVTRYTQYINDFLDAMQPDSIMYDDYPLRKDKNGNLKIHDTYIHCLQIVAKAASDKGIKFYHLTQSHQNNAEGEEHKREVTENGAKWLNNILLGFGAKQLAYYTYYTRGESDSEGTESYVDGKSFVDYNGNPTELYYWMQKIMANDQKFAPTIMQFDYKGSKVYGSTSADYLSKATKLSSSFAKLYTVSVSTGSALVTELYDDEKDNYMYMAMNVLDPDATNTAETVQMTFSGYTHVLVYVDGESQEVALTNGVYTATLNNGDAVYVIPYNN